MLLVAAMFLFASCSIVTNGTSTTAPADLDVLDKVRSLDILPRGEQPITAFKHRLTQAV